MSASIKQFFLHSASAGGGQSTSPSPVSSTTTVGSVSVAGLPALVPYTCVGDRIAYRLPSDNMGEAPSLFSGIKTVPLKSSAGRRTSVLICHADPVPLDIISIAVEVEVGPL